MEIKIVLIGRSNVGKSSLFNCLASCNNAIVSSLRNTTRDRQYQTIFSVMNIKCIIIDTPGVDLIKKKYNSSEWLNLHHVIEESDIIFFLVNAQEGCVSYDNDLSKLIRKKNKPVFLLVNKIDSINLNNVLYDFLLLGFKNTYFISAKKKINISFFQNKILLPYIKTFITNNKKYRLFINNENIKNKLKTIRIAIIGKPNVGKSTIINNILKTNRMVTSDRPETTRDSIQTSYIYKDIEYIFFDTAGIRKKKKNIQSIEKNAVKQTIKSVIKSDLSILVMNSSEELSYQDLFLIRYLKIQLKPFVILINKWDLIPSHKKSFFKKNVLRVLHFIPHIPILFISGLFNKTIFYYIKKVISQVYKSMTTVLYTSTLTKLLHKILKKKQPPMIQGKKIKLKFAHPEQKCNYSYSKIIVIYGNKTHLLNNNYVAYLTNMFQKELQLIGTSIKLIFKNTNNPYIHN
ncbi:ribosome biogenesis GTPase Der [Buchnera aphidicola (Thelaxes californica)]|uniref:GTPase Der n=1 Tax=Buchnera aphidicola (Thelaxes californica) TaxID=1315998 RepID=A0A4D6YP89_9GAMM|nr:ribosome biogenesis GTPase Der [Buchnera aphidicola]QCI26985.1 ribosome biogenesis GTPase Der [Buchnera aphidicola (Thelaxes californica)]